MDFFGDFGVIADDVKVVKLGVTRLNLTFDPDTGPLAFLLTFDHEAPELCKSFPTGTVNDIVIDTRIYYVDRLLDVWLSDMSRATLEELPAIMDVTRRTEFDGITTLICLRFFSRFFDDLKCMINELELICKSHCRSSVDNKLADLSVPLKSMLEMFKKLDQRQIELAFDHHIRGEDYEQFPELDIDWMYVDVSHL